MAHPPPKTQQRRLLKHLAIAAFLLVQFALPISYYLGDDIYDERFAWRMFSPIRMVRCEVKLAEDAGQGRAPLKASRVMAMPWHNWMKRGHRRVVRAFAEHRCAQASSEGKEIAFYADVSCRLPSGEVDRLFLPSEDLCAAF